MLKTLENRDAYVRAGVDVPIEHPIVVSFGGHLLRSTREMGELFLKSARLNARTAGAALTVLSHSRGVELLHITEATPVTVRDVGGAKEVTLWRWPEHSPISDEPCDLASLISGSTPTTTQNGPTVADLQERILSAAYTLFTHHAVHDVTREQVQEAASVTADELQTAFPSMDVLVEKCLERREREWTIGVVRAGIDARTDEPEERLLAIFDVFDEWFHRDDYEACTFVNVLLEMGKDHPLGRASVEHLAYIRSLIAGLAEDAGLRDPESFAYSWHILMKGAIVNAAEGDSAAALRARAMGGDLIARHRPAVPRAEADYHLDPRWALG